MYPLISYYYSRFFIFLAGMAAVFSEGSVYLLEDVREHSAFFWVSLACGVCMYICMYMYVCMYVCMCIYIYEYFLYEFIYVYIYIYIQVVSGVCVWITILQAVVNQNYSLTWISKYFRYLGFFQKMKCSNKCMNICDNVIILLGSICVNFLLYTNNVVENQGMSLCVYIYVFMCIYMDV
jgi:hypothetical protein